MKTAEVELSCHMTWLMTQKSETRCEKKNNPLFCLKCCPKKLYFTKNSLLQRPLFSKEPARGPVHTILAYLSAIGLIMRSVLVAECIVLLTLDHGVTGLSSAGNKILTKSKLASLLRVFITTPYGPDIT